MMEVLSQVKKRIGRTERKPATPGLSVQKKLAAMLRELGINEYTVDTLPSEAEKTLSVAIYVATSQEANSIGEHINAKVLGGNPSRSPFDIATREHVLPEAQKKSGRGTTLENLVRFRYRL